MPSAIQRDVEHIRLSAGVSPVWDVIILDSYTHELMIRGFDADVGLDGLSLDERARIVAFLSDQVRLAAHHMRTSWNCT